MLQTTLFKIEDESENEVLEFRYLITSYGVDYTVDTIVKRIKEKVIFIPPFQRKFVWNINEASKFIESLILGLPVPGVFLSKEKETNKSLIVDGQQRLLSLYAFYKEKFKGEVFSLQGVQKDLEGKTYSTLRPEDKLRLDDSIIHATIIRQDEPDDNNSSIYQIFERLNSGGRALTVQEIRACIYYGDLNELLNSLTKTVQWRIIFGRKENERLKEQELVLRFFALYFSYKDYQKPLKNHLNTFMFSNRNLEVHSKDQLSSLFNLTFDFLSSTLGGHAFKLKRGINAAVFDSVSIAVATRLQNGAITDTPGFKEAYEELIKDDVKYLPYVIGSTTDEKALVARIDTAIEKFQNIG